ncbi:MAG: acyl-CoA dehydrogenase family protein [Anaerolineales bacterium]
MNFKLSQEHQMWREAVHGFAAEVLKPKAAELDEAAEFHHEAVPQMAALGLLAMNIDEEYGGAGIDALGSAIAMEELGWACAGTALSLGAHNALACEPINRYGTQQLKDAWLPGLASGEAGLAALALTEPGTGSDLAGGIQTRASLEGEEWVIRGSKAWITNASLSPFIVTLCRTGEAPASNSLSLILVPSDAEGLTIHAKEKKMGMRSSPTHALSYDDVRVPVDNVIGETGQGLYHALAALDGGRIGIGALSVGLARAALEAAVDYAKDRETFGQPISQHQAVRFMLADASAQIESARLMVYQAAWLKDQGEDFTGAAAKGKLVASEAAERICRDAIQIHGGYGYSREYPVERMYRDVRLMTIGEGTSEIQRMVIARRMLD